MDFVMEIWGKAKSRQKKLVLPEGTDARMLKAAKMIVEERIAASVTVLGKISEVQKLGGDHPNVLKVREALAIVNTCAFTLAQAK